MKKFLVLLLALVLAFGCFGGCGGSDDEEQIKITVGISGDATENRLMKKWKERYETDNPNIKIAFKNIADNYTQAIMGYEQSPKTMPDIIWTTGEQHVAWSERGVFINLKPRLQSDSEIDLNDFYVSMLETTHKSSHDDGIYFIPRDYNKCVIIINKVVFRYSGFTDEEIDNLKDGWNYAKFLEVCERLRNAMDNAGEDDECYNYGVRPDSVPLDARMDFDASYMSFIKHFGGKLVEDNGKIDFISEANLDAYGEIYNLIRKRYIASEATKASTSFSYNRAAMKIDVRPNVPSLPNTAKYDIDFLPLPLDYVGVGCSGYAISSVAKTRVSTSSANVEKLSNEEYAYRFLKFIVSEEGQKLGASTGSIVPVLKSLKSDESWTAYKSASLNHAAFISNEERDFNLNVYRDFKPTDAAVILVNMGNVITYVCKEDSYSDGGKTAGYGVLIDAIKGFQNSVKNYTVVS
ncbi:MAG: extracellular solute-binding protein [Clostridia bacterium]|nr:extracellular solute-binding protein [Clostridia bacterium]